MKYAEDKNYVLYQGKMQDVIDNELEENSIDCIITDPPYGLTSITDRFGKENSAPAQEGTDGAFKRLSKGFMGQTWDGSGVEYDISTWQRCLKVLKPGGYLLAFGGSRTFHRIACAIEDAGFEIRDTIMWLYGSGFPKSMNIGLAIDKKNGVDNRTGNIKTDGKATNSKATNSGSGCYNCNNGKDNSMKQEYEERIAQNEWNGWGTCLKPAYEPIIVARKPFKGSLVDNVLEYGIGGLNIDECRAGVDIHKVNINDFSNQHGNKFGNRESIAKLGEKEIAGRFPGNVILTYDDADKNEVCGGFPDTKSTYNKDCKHEEEIHRQNADTLKYGYKTRIDSSSYNDEGSAARYFYCAKASSKDRDEGLEEFEKINVYENQEWGYANTEDDNFGDRIANVKRANIHPTVKPTELMQYLIRLVAPEGAVILDPFMGSGSTGKAAMFENRERNKNYKFIGIEMTEQYLPICKARIDYAKYKYEYDIKVEDKKDKQSGIQSIFDYIG